MQLSKWGNSLAIRIPSAVVETLDLHEGDDIEVRVAEQGVFELRRKPDSIHSLEALRRFRGKLPEDFVFNREEFSQRD